MVRGTVRQDGVAYLVLLISLAIIGMAASASIMIGAQMGRRDAELHLLAIGREFEAALTSYRKANGQGPTELADLLADHRTPAIARHLRQIYADPLTGKAEWGVVRDETKQITAIFSLAPGKPIKQAGFDEDHAQFEKATAYRQWLFRQP